MSYILDALRRADAERQRGAVPGLHAPTVSVPAAAAAVEPSRARRGRLWAGASLLLLAGMGAGWHFGRPPGAVSSRDSAAAGAAVAARPAPLAARGPASLLPLPLPAPAPAPAMAPMAAAVAEPVPPIQAAQTASAEWPAQARPQTAAPAVAVSSAAGLSPSLTGAARAMPGAASARIALPEVPASEAHLPTWAELPEAQRREMPALSLGGAMHAEQAELRVAIINGQVFHEGDLVAPGLTLRSIRPKVLVFDFRGQRFEMPL